MAKTSLSPQFIFLESCTSTNEEAARLIKEGRATEGTVIHTLFQTKGKGQKGSSWESEGGKNLTFSLILSPRFLPLEKHFFISITTSLGLIHCLKKFLPGICIKWPNDLYYQGKKLGGILIENSIEQSKLKYSILGIGINVNQEQFSRDIPNPASLKGLLNRQFMLDRLLGDLCYSLFAQYSQLQDGLYSLLLEDYYTFLWGYQEFLPYESVGERFSARIHSVKETGEIVLGLENGELREYGFKEVELLIPE